MSIFGEVQVTVAGTVVSEPELFVCANGSPRAAFRLVAREVKHDRDQDRWITVRSSYYTVVCWRNLADHVASAVGKSDPVLVTGRQRVADWSEAAGRGPAVEISAVSVGHDLRYGLSRFQRVRRGADSPDPFAADHLAQPAGAPAPGRSPAAATEQSAGSTKI
ncbi:MAG TPA: single-stranded DNA-binding protein [Actinocrinis sp.]|nr:single-stranded DNA-binding protein [Actinocrinis sp.]